MITISFICYSISRYVSLGIFSFIVNLFLLILIKKNMFGIEIKKVVDEILKNRFSFYIYYFVFVFIFIFLVKLNLTIIFLDSVDVNLTVNGIDAKVSGDIVSFIKESFGDAAAFTVCARLAQLVISKNVGLSSFSKIGIIIASGTGGLTSYKVVNRGLNVFFGENPIILNGQLQLNNVNINTIGNYPRIPNHPVLDYLFGMNSNINFLQLQQGFNVTNNPLGITLTDNGNGSQIINALNNQNPYWRSQFINFSYNSNSNNPIISSTNEGDTNLISFLIDSLTDQLYLSIISIYLLFMLFLIFICKFILSNDIKFNLISKIKIFNLNVGENIVKFLKWFISIWQKSSSYWIIFIIAMLLIFYGVTLFSIFTMLKILKNFI